MNTNGIGLGLVISDNIVHQFGGKIGVKSKYGKGSTFMFSILLGRDDNYVDKKKHDINLRPLIVHTSVYSSSKSLSSKRPLKTVELSKLQPMEPS